MALPLLSVTILALANAVAGESAEEPFPLFPYNETWSYLPPHLEDWSVYRDSINDTDLYPYGYYFDANGVKRGIDRPECYFEEFTGACCVKAGMNGHTFRTCIEVGLQLSEMKASAVLHVNDKEIVSKSVQAGKLCATLPPPLPPTKICLNIYYGAASWSQKQIETCAAVELANLVHVRFDCFRFAQGKFLHHGEIQPEKYGLVNVYWQNGRPRFQIVSQPISDNVRKWIWDQWTKIKNAFRQKSRHFISWLWRKL